MSPPTYTEDQQHTSVVREGWQQRREMKTPQASAQISIKENTFLVVCLDVQLDKIENSLENTPKNICEGTPREIT